MSDYETIIAEYEAELIYAQDQYFIARPQINRTIERDKIFEAGFKAAYYKNTAKHLGFKVSADKKDKTDLLSI